MRRESVHDLGAAARDGEGTGSVPLSFTDATTLRDGRVLYLAAAEDTEDAVADGPVLGAAVGVLEEGAGRYALLTEVDGTPSRRKVEGVAVEADGRRAFMVVDPDDADLPSDLCEVVLDGPW